MRIINTLKDKGFSVTVGKIKFGKESKSENPKVICPKCGSKIVMRNGLKDEYSVSAGICGGKKWQR